jgi:hypothetical protein
MVPSLQGSFSVFLMLPGTAVPGFHIPPLTGLLLAWLLKGVLA